MAVSESEIQFFAEGLNLTEELPEDSDAPDFDAMIYVLVSAYYAAGPTAFAEEVEEHRVQLNIACRLSEKLKQVVLIGLRMGTDAGDGACANELGALYYTGDIVEQSYQKAAEYYELAAQAGYVQAMVNLGYIHEYGRLGAADPHKAYMYYSFAAAVYDSSEALYKMGDMFAAGRGVDANGRAALTLWQRALDNAADPENRGQAAFRIAQVLADEGTCAELGIEFDPLMALQLFQTAEVGLRISVQQGLTYYEKRLQQAIDGQQRARELLD